ncbi:MAG: tetratricopeptide repeat protein [Candidatus Acidiferrales bacterium]
MNRAALFVIPLAFLFVIGIDAPQFAASAQSSQPSAAASAPENSAASPTDTPAMTQFQKDELRGDIFMARKEYREAIETYHDLTKETPRNAVLLNKLGVAYQQLDDLGRAEHYYKKSLKADKTYASATNNLGTVAYEKKHYPKAIRDYQHAVALRADMPTIYSNLGYAYFANAQYPEAIGAFQRALALDPDVFAHHEGYGSLVQQRSTTDPGLFYFLIAKTYAESGNAVQSAHYLKLARDEGYANFLSARTDPAFAKVIKDPAVKEVLVVPPSYAGTGKTARQN